MHAGTAQRAPEPTVLAQFARRPVFAAMAAVAVVLTVVSDGYGYHRDELYFRLLRPAWGYVDQPPLTPLLARLFRMLADEPWALRIPATLSTVSAVLLVALITRELGGGRGAQTLCAWAFAFSSFPLVLGHVFLTASLDLVVWPGVLLLIMRAVLRDEPRWWLAAGALVGLSVYNKLLIAVLLLSVGVGLVLVGPRAVLRSKWLLAGAVLALVLGAPNLVYQAAHGWPQLSMGRALSRHNGGTVRATTVPFLGLLLGPPLVPIWIAGIVALLRRPQWRPVRFLAVAFPVLVVLVLVMGSQSYYPIGLLAALFAAGCIPTWDWILRGARWRRVLLIVGVAANAAICGVIGLPLIPQSVLGKTPVPGINQAARDQIGWPTYVAEIATVYRTLPAADRARAVVYASNYGEAGAVDRYGGRDGLPRVYSAQNALYDLARPPASATVVVVVGGQARQTGGEFASCLIVSKLDNRLGVDNEEQGEPIAICRDPVGGWPALWPRLRHLD